MNSGFLDKLIERIGRVGPEEVQNYLLRLAREKGVLETIFNALHEGIIVTDTRGNISFVNEAACNLFGLARDECMGKLLSERITGLDWDSLTRTEAIISRDMEVFYPQNRFINFYVAPISLIERKEKKGARRKPHDKQEKQDKQDKSVASGFGSAPARENVVGFAIILRDITESRR